MRANAGRPESRRRALIGAALREIADRGSLDVTMAQIAARAGVSSALAHHYFGAKEDLLIATMRHLLADFASGAVGELRRAEGPRARVSAVVRASFAADQFHRATIAAWLAFYAKALSAPEAARLLSVYQRRLRSNLVHDLRAFLPRAGAEEAARGIGAMIDGLYLREALGGGSARPAEAIALVENYVDLRVGRGKA
ncbi:transcriptional regulator BetI [Amaricoccus sp.]|uniref:choline-binding transcriptional repressor BetI n=1 Tax=Amaricoccus sp. TaxID=1872485 RepID=UPI001B481D92|nr:transcriptional regulator BetI [Amaricoccus sp.]MBP7243646.1 transcriptional regulator BetI [Amaricoccus sp.]